MGKRTKSECRNIQLQCGGWSEPGSLWWRTAIHWIGATEESRRRRLVSAEPPSAEMTTLSSLSFIRGARGARRRAPPDDIDFVPVAYRAPPPRSRTQHPTSSALLSRLPTHLRQKLRLNDMMSQLKMAIRVARPTLTPRSLMDPRAESHSVEITTTRPLSVQLEKISFLLQLKW